MTPIEKKRFLRVIWGIVLLAAFGAAALAIIKKTGGFIPCPIYKLTGYRCPGCGNTRAFTALVHLRFWESLSFNYAYPAEFIYMLVVFICMAKNYVKKGNASYYPKHPAFDYVFLAVLIGWGIARNVLGV